MKREDMSRRGFGALFLAGGVSALVPARPALAQNPTEQQMLNALIGRGTRGTVPAPGFPRPDEAERRLLEALRDRPARAISPKERTNLEEMTRDKPNINIEINFDYNSDVIGPRAMGPLLGLGRVLSNADLKGNIFLINGHTDAKGGDQYNLTLSERRAEAVKRILIEHFKLPAGALIPVGYGKTRLKNVADPFAGENRRVQIVNTQQQAAAGR